MNRRAGLLLALLAAAALGGWAWTVGGGRDPVSEQVLALNRANTDRRREALLAEGKYDGDGWRRMVAASPGEWLFAHPEEGQTFEEYVAFDPLVRGAGRDGIVLRPLSPLRPHAQAALERVREHCGLFFAAEARLAEPRPLPPEAFRPERQQYDAEQLLRALKDERPAGALVYAGICDQDLIVRGLDNYLFGLGEFRAGLGVYSFQRFHYPGVDERLYLRRAMKLLTHEIGHGFGLRHCIYYRCTMNGGNSLPEVDGAPLEPCLVCLRKLQHSLGFDVKARWTALATFFERVGFAEEAAWTRARLADLEQSGRPVPWRD